MFLVTKNNDAVETEELVMLLFGITQHPGIPSRLFAGFFRWPGIDVNKGNWRGVSRHFSHEMFALSCHLARSLLRRLLPVAAQIPHPGNEHDFVFNGFRLADE